MTVNSMSVKSSFQRAKKIILKMKQKEGKEIEKKRLLMSRKWRSQVRVQREGEKQESDNVHCTTPTQYWDWELVGIQ